jgi:RNA polymerase sigma-70 factor (ECF subfamily)
VAARASYIEKANPGQDEFERLVEQYYEPLFKFAMSLTRAETQASDLVQDTFVTWAEKGAQLADRTKSKAWLFTTLHRHFLQTTRHDARFPHLEIDSMLGELPEVEPQVVNQLESSELLEILHRIDPRFQASVALFYLEDYSYAEIAAILEIPLGTVKSRIARGLAQLKEMLSKARGGFE